MNREYLSRCYLGVGTLAESDDASGTLRLVLASSPGGILGMCIARREWGAGWESIARRVSVFIALADWPGTNGGRRGCP